MLNDMKYRVLLTGGSRGIGKAIALALSGKTERLYLVGREQSALEQVASELAGVDVVILAGDLTDATFQGRVVNAVADGGGVNLLINNAGISDFSAFEQQRPENIERLVITNLLTPILLTQRLLPMMLRETQAQVINIGSGFSYIAYPGFAAYSASKFGLRGFSQALSRELADTTVKVRFFSPRATKTDINPAAVNWLNQQLSTAEDSAEEVAQQFMDFLSTDRAEYQVGFPEKIFTKLNQILPALVSRALYAKLPVIRRAMAFSSINS